MCDSFGKIKKGFEFENIVFVFRFGVVFVCREKIRKKVKVKVRRRIWIVIYIYIYLSIFYGINFWGLISKFKFIDYGILVRIVNFVKFFILININMKFWNIGV